MQIRLFTIPNFVTLGNLLCGCGASVAALVYGDFTAALWLLVAAAVFDFADGATARLLKQYSELGVQLDSLADMISFGFTPAAILFAVSADAPSAFGLDAAWVAVFRFAVFVVAAFSALRLAKFNIDDTQHEEFCGLPTPACAMFCASLGMLCATGRLSLPREALTAAAVVMAALLVSPIRMFSLKFRNLSLRENALRYIFVLLCVAAIFFARAYALVAIIVMYVAISSVRWIAQRGR
ncbi:MAG: CDP-alcohol phosphatidyltransferase family protein [Alistipes sp.]|nr:CDP-alcohol phosphatidyltransferase family protein [Alistipes sp.]